MPGRVQLIYWDSCVFLSYINAESERIDILDAVFEDIMKSNGEKKIVTSIISKVEVAASSIESTSRTILADVEGRIDALWSDDSVVEIIEFHDGIALQARDLMRRALAQGWSLKPPDAIHLASALWLSVDEIHTYDDKWPRYAPLVGRKICEPYITQLRLNF